MIKQKTPKPKKCQAKKCRKIFTPQRMGQKVCSPICAIRHTEQVKQKEFSAETRRLKDKVKTKAQWLAEAQAAFNGYIRVRDKGQSCISCDKPDNGQHQRHASHYRSRAAASQLRFNLINVWTSCATCNAILSGNQIEYRIRLVRRLGAERVEALENDAETRRYSIEYAKRVKSIFRRRAKLYKKLFR